MAVPQTYTAIHADPPTQPAPAGERIATIYTEYRALITRFILQTVRNRELAEDLTAQVFMKALRSLDTTRDSASIRSWLYRVARTVIQDYHRSLYRLRTQSLETLLSAHWDAAEPVAEPEQDSRVPDQSAEQVRWILARLSERDRIILTMRFLLHQSVKETAEHLHMREDNLRVAQFRALAKARQMAWACPD